MKYKEKTKNARAFIVLLAAFITELLNIKYNREILNSMIILLVVIIIFFIIATVAIRLAEKISCMESPKQEEYDFEEDDEIAENSENTVN